MTLEVQRLFFEWFFRKDYCFSRDLQSTIQGDYSFYGLWLPGMTSFFHLHKNKISAIEEWYKQFYKNNFPIQPWDH